MVRLLQLFHAAMKNKTTPVTISIGAAVYGQPPESPDEAIGAADGLMYGSKTAGKNTLDPGQKDVMSGKSTGGVRRSSGDGMRAGESQRNTGSPPRWGQVAATGTPRGAGRAAGGGGGVRSSEEAG
jgi:hypothetical protein